MTFAVEKLRGPTIWAIHVEGLGLLTQDEALQLAARLAFVADGCMVSLMTDGRVEGWNNDSAFHRAYKAIMESRFEEPQ